MKLYDELYFDIELTGTKANVKKFAMFLKSGELDEFFDVSSEYISYNDNYAEVGEEEETGLVFTNEDIGIEIDVFRPEEFLDVFCKAARALDVTGQLYDAEEELSFTSAAGDSGYINAKDVSHRDELDELEDDDDDDYDESDM